MIEREGATQMAGGPSGQDPIDTMMHLLQGIWDRYGEEMTERCVVAIAPDVQSAFGDWLRKARWYTTAGDPTEWKSMTRPDGGVPSVDLATDFGTIHIQVHEDVPERTIEIWQEMADRRTDQPLASATRIDP